MGYGGFSISNYSHRWLLDFPFKSIDFDSPVDYVTVPDRYSCAACHGKLFVMEPLRAVCFVKYLMQNVFVQYARERDIWPFSGTTLM